MQKTPHLVVSISGHGFGHVAQTAPILNQLHAYLPRLKLTVRSSVPISHLRSRIRAPFTYMESHGDIGMVMHTPVSVDIEKSRSAYQIFHAHWEEKVAAEAQILRTLRADMVFSNVGYLPLAAAQQAGITNLALCSLNWADIYRHYCGADRVEAQIRQPYIDADAFLRATPGMEMQDLPNLLPVAPIADIGQNRRDELNQFLKLSSEDKLVLVSMGGITSRLSVDNWPRIKGVRWLIQASWQTTHPDAIVLESLPVNFSDLLASCDALICKPGYGSFVEAACSGVPILYVDRPDWPESPALIVWMNKNGVSREISSAALEQGNIINELEQLLSSPETAPFKPDGAEQVAGWIAERLK